MSEIKGINTRKVFDHYLSTVTPTIYNSGKFWRIVLDYKDGSGVAEAVETNIPCEKGDTYDCEKIKCCFEWIKSVRDKYSMPNLEELKPKVAVIRLINDDMHEKARGIPTQAEYKVFSAQYALDLINLAEAS